MVGIEYHAEQIAAKDAEIASLREALVEEQQHNAALQDQLAEEQRQKREALGALAHCRERILELGSKLYEAGGVL
jgi:chromosome segregation ATPase